MIRTWRDIDTSLIPDSNYIEEVVNEDGDTQEIMNAILEADSENDTRFERFARQFPRTKDGLKILWGFTRYAITYQEDGFNRQDVKLAAALWKVQKGDCKSKTLFINQVLKVLNIPYKIRFVGYDGKSIKHVYTVALWNGQEIPIDSVYKYFSKEPYHNIKKDYPMTRISIIRGVSSSSDGEFDVQKKFEEIQQRKRYVAPQEPINFAKLSEGQALLKSLERKLIILGTMNDNKQLAEEGINYIRTALKSGNLPTGIVSDQAQPIVAKINQYLQMNAPAVGHGVRGAALRMHQVKAKQNCIGVVPGTECIANLWYRQDGGTGTTVDPYQYTNMLDIPPFVCSPAKLAQFNSLSNVYFFYGRSFAQYRTNWNDSSNDFATILNDLAAQYPTIIDNGYGEYLFANQSTYDACIEALKQKMPVLSNWANDLFRADNTVDATVGTGLLYSFIPDFNQLVAGITPADFPTVVGTKMVLQSQFLDSCVNFSSISKLVLTDLVENGILFDTGGQAPNRVLSALLQKYNPNVGIAPAIAALIVGILQAVLAAVPAIIAACNGSATGARLIDSTAADTAQFATQNASTLPANGDFLRPSDNNGGGGNKDTDGNNSLGLFLLASAVTGGLAISRNSKNNKSKSKKRKRK